MHPPFLYARSTRLIQPVIQLTWLQSRLRHGPLAYKKFRIRLKVFHNQPFVIGMYSL